MRESFPRRPCALRFLHAVSLLATASSSVRSRTRVSRSSLACFRASSAAFSSVMSSTRTTYLTVSPTEAKAGNIFTTYDLPVAPSFPWMRTPLAIAGLPCRSSFTRSQAASPSRPQSSKILNLRPPSLPSLPIRSSNCLLAEIMLPSGPAMHMASGVYSRMSPTRRRVSYSSRLTRFSSATFTVVREYSSSATVMKMSVTA